VLNKEQILLLSTAIIPPIISFLLFRFASSRPKLIPYVGYISDFTLDDGDLKVYTNGIVIKNTGSKPALNVKIGYYFLPDHIKMHPPIDYKTNRTKNRTEEIQIDRILPGAEINISYLYFQPVAYNEIHAYVQSDDECPEIINKIPDSFQPPKSVIYVRRILMFIGFTTIFYLIGKLLIN